MFVYFYCSYVLKKVVAVVYCFHLFKQNGSPYQCNLLPLMLATMNLLGGSRGPSPDNC